ncbi:hypothetical protein Nepgr_012710 [Nepenthes gracilis]|uniref:Uncharacterized protein n=1 Tax=Nepenthes gracilis TaxID=150966 RepID=A0AAD3SHR0_NEPGR|nr:hypothetical protein Nepgr_012710 [Nepenthes gracilis]
MSVVNRWHLVMVAWEKELNNLTWIMQTLSHCHPFCFVTCRRNSIKPDKWMKTENSVAFEPNERLRRRVIALKLRFLKPVRQTISSAIFNSTDGHPSVAVTHEDTAINHSPNIETETLFSNWSPPRYLWRGLSVVILAGQVIIRTLKGKVHWRNTLQQLERVGPKSVGVCLLTAAFVGMAFTIQFVREFTRLGLNRSVGGVLALAFSRELSPVVTSIVVAGRIGSAFAAELGTMQVSEQTDTLRVLGTNPVDYLVTPRVIACCVALPFLTLMCFTVGMASSALLARRCLWD